MINKQYIRIFQRYGKIKLNVIDKVVTTPMKEKKKPFLINTSSSLDLPVLTSKNECKLYLISI